MRRPGGLWDGGESLYLSQGIKGDENSSVKQTRGGVISGAGERTAEEHCLRSSLSDAAQDRGWQCLFFFLFLLAPVMSRRRSGKSQDSIEYSEMLSRAKGPLYRSLNTEKWVNKGCNVPVNTQLHLEKKRNKPSKYLFHLMPLIQESVLPHAE